MSQVLKIISGVLIAALVIWLGTVWWKYEPPDNTQYVNNAIYDSMKFEIQCLKADKSALSDSIFGYAVDLGYTEIELNRSKAEFDRLVSNYKGSKIIRDTIKQLQQCDSIIYEIESNYVPKSAAALGMAFIIDSMRQIQVHIGDSIEFKDNELINLLSKDILTERTNNAILTDKIKRKKKIPIFAAIGGFVAGILVIAFIH
jgi:hypothetical protein